MFIQLPSPLDAFLDTAPAGLPEADCIVTLTVPPGPRGRRWADGTAAPLAGAAGRWPLKVNGADEAPLTWTAAPPTA